MKKIHFNKMVQLFGKDKRTISEHIRNVFKQGELNENIVVRKFRTTTQNGAIFGICRNNGTAANAYEYRRLEKDLTAFYN